VGPLALVVLLGAGCGAASMGLYALVSPQRRLGELKDLVREARGALLAYEGDFAGAWPLMRRQIALSFRHLGLTLLPTLVAALPVVGAAFWLAGRHGDAILVTGAPRWAGGWEAPFIAAAFAASLAIKLRWRIH
jgi:hypothetical protein